MQATPQRRAAQALLGVSVTGLSVDFAQRGFSLEARVALKEIAIDDKLQSGARLVCSTTRRV